MSERSRAAAARRKKRRDFWIGVIAILGALAVCLMSLLVCMLVFDLSPKEEAAPVTQQQTAVYDPSEPFSLGDLTGHQLEEIRAQGKISVSDGPRGLSIGDKMDTVLERFPTESRQTVLRTSGQTGTKQEDEMTILYCAKYEQGSTGNMIVLPPRGLMTLDNGFPVITLLAPTSAYPQGTFEDYNRYEHAYCQFRFNPDTMTIMSITLGIYQ